MQRKESSAADDQNETGGSGRLLNRLFSQSISSSLLYTFLKKKLYQFQSRATTLLSFFPWCLTSQPLLRLKSLNCS